MERVTSGADGGIREILQMRKNLASPIPLFHNPSNICTMTQVGRFMVTPVSPVRLPH